MARTEEEEEEKNNTLKEWSGVPDQWHGQWVSAGLAAAWSCMVSAVPGALGLYQDHPGGVSNGPPYRKLYEYNHYLTPHADGPGMLLLRHSLVHVLFSADGTWEPRSH